MVDSIIKETATIRVPSTPEVKAISDSAVLVIPNPKLTSLWTDSIKACRQWSMFAKHGAEAPCVTLLADLSYTAIIYIDSSSPKLLRSRALMEAATGIPIILRAKETLSQWYVIVVLDDLVCSDARAVWMPRAMLLLSAQLKQ
jgi:hypothetical protein